MTQQLRTALHIFSITAFLFVGMPTWADDEASGAKPAVDSAPKAEAVAPPKEATEKKAEAKKPVKAAKTEKKAGKKIKKGGMEYEVTKAGKKKGKVAKAGQTVSVHYDGKLENGTPFDSSRKRGEPFSFLLGAKQVIPGWDVGVEGMKEGESRILYIPSDMAYGDRGVPGAIPPKAKLIFEVELLEVK